ncbi:hypothetical protein ACQ4PT_011935 [Festuca glaucescens]
MGRRRSRSWWQRARDGGGGERGGGGDHERGGANPGSREPWTAGVEKGRRRRGQDGGGLLWDRAGLDLAVNEGISCMIISFGTGVALLFCGMVVPKDNALHTIAFPVFTIVIVLIDGVVLLVRAQEKKTGGNEQAIRDLIIKLVEITISIIRLVDFKAHTHKHWDAEKILRLVGCSLPVLIGICLICFMLYNVRTLFLPKLIEWRGKTTRVFAVDQDGELRTLFLSKLIEWRSKIARVFAVDQDGDVQGQPAEDGTVDVELRIQGQVAEDGTVDVELRMQGQAAEDGTVDVELGTLFLSKLIEWRGMITRVFAVDQDGDVQGQAAEDGIVDV